MLTEREKTVIREWNEFAAKMPPSLHEMRKALDAESAKMNVDPPEVGAFHPARRAASRPARRCDRPERAPDRIQ